MFLVKIQGTAVFPCYFCFGGGKIFPMLRSVLFTHKTILNPVCCLFFTSISNFGLPRITAESDCQKCIYGFLKFILQFERLSADEKKATWRSRNKKIRRKLKPVGKRARKI